MLFGGSAAWWLGVIVEGETAAIEDCVQGGDVAVIGLESRSYPESYQRIQEQTLLYFILPHQKLLGKGPYLGQTEKLGEALKAKECVASANGFLASRVGAIRGLRKGHGKGLNELLHIEFRRPELAAVLME